MNIREKIGKMPVWQAGLITILSAGLIVIGIEEYCINKLFSVMNQLVTKLEVQFTDDVKDMENDYKAFNAEQEYNKIKSDLLHFKLNQSTDDPDHTQKFYCAYLAMNKKLEALYNLAYVKHQDGASKSIALEIKQNKKFIETANKEKIFDITQCKDEKK